MTGSAPLAVGSVSARLYPHDLPAVEQIEVLRRQARQAVEVGYDGVMVSEHHADFPGTSPTRSSSPGSCSTTCPADGQHRARSCCR
ncbi:MAG: hypothetical protein R2695_13295 [Acidimicrobiales bacterium]